MAIGGAGIDVRSRAPTLAPSVVRRSPDWQSLTPDGAAREGADRRRRERCERKEHDQCEERARVCDQVVRARLIVRRDGRPPPESRPAASPDAAA
jgi:hypothetical protein